MSGLSKAGKDAMVSAAKNFFTGACRGDRQPGSGPVDAGAQRDVDKGNRSRDEDQGSREPGVPESRCEEREREDGGGSGVLNGNNLPVFGEQTVVVGRMGAGSSDSCGQKAEAQFLEIVPAVSRHPVATRIISERLNGIILKI
jgi:hypothetical protein